MKEKVYKLYLKGNKPAIIAELLGIEASKVSAILTTIPREIRLENLEMYEKKLSKGYVRWNEYILSPNRNRFFKMAKNGLWVKYKPNSKLQYNQVVKRLGKTYLTKIEKELNQGELNG